MKGERRARMRALLGVPRNVVYLPVGIESRNNTTAPSIPEGTKTLFTYLAHAGEIDPSRVIDDAIARGITVAAPAVLANRELEFRAIDSSSGPFLTGAFGIREPLTGAKTIWPGKLQDADFPLVILVPGLAFAQTGARLGRGAGYYDRFLSRFLTENESRQDSITLIGACHSFQIVESLPAEPHDIPVDCILSENGCIVCINSGEE